MIMTTTATPTAKMIPAGETLSWLREVQTSSCWLFLKQLLSGLQEVIVATEGVQSRFLPREGRHVEVGWRIVLKQSRDVVGFRSIVSEAVDVAILYCGLSSYLLHIQAVYCEGQGRVELLEQ